MTFLAMLGLMTMAMKVTAISMSVMTLFLVSLRHHQRPPPTLALTQNLRTAMGEALRYPFNFRLSCLHRLPENASGSVGSGVGVIDMYAEQPGTREPFFVNKDGARSVASSGVAVRETVGNKKLGNQTVMPRPRSSGSRHVLVKDTAFQT